MSDSDTDTQREDDLSWGLEGTNYLLEVDAHTPAKRTEVESLRRRLIERMRAAGTVVSTILLAFRVRGL